MTDRFATPPWFAPVLNGGRSGPRLAVCESHGPNGQDLLAATALALEDAGRRDVGIVVGDDARSPETAGTLAARLAGEGVRHVVGHFGSTTARAAAEVYAGAGALFLAPGSSSPLLCGPRTGTTVQFFSTDVQQVACFVARLEGVRDVLVVAQARNYGAVLGRDLLSALSRSGSARAQLLCLPATARRLPARPGPAVAAICLLGSQEFGAGLLAGLREAGFRGQVLLSDDCSGAPALADPDGNAFAAFPAACAETCFDRPLAGLLARAAALLGRPPGCYFETSYVAVRALARAWAGPGGSEPAAARRAILAGAYPSSRGLLTFDADGRLQGHRWAFAPVGVPAGGSAGPAGALARVA